jgi:uncharacterized Zn-finger protein
MYIIIASQAEAAIECVSAIIFIKTFEVPSVPNPDTASVAGDGSLILSNAENCYEVTPADLPLHCPMEGMSLWNSHPRVYLPIEATGKAKCPYCGADYTLRD